MTTLWFVGSWAVRSSLVILTGALLLRFCRVKDASVRLAAYVGILCASLLIPAVTAGTPALPLPLSTQSSSAAPAAAAIQVLVPVMVAPGPPKVATAEPRIMAERILIVFYVTVTSILLLRLIVGLVLGLRLLWQSRRTDRMVAGIEVRESDSVTVPVTLGVLRPAIVLPDDWREWDEYKLQAVLAHERSHVQRKDSLVQVLSAAHRAFLWITPLSWFLHRQIVRVAEEASDDAALAAVKEPATYAGILLDFMRSHSRRVAWQGVAMARNGDPEQRIRRILEGTGISRGVSQRTVIAIVAMLAPVTYVAAATRPQQPVLPAAPAVVVQAPSAQPEPPASPMQAPAVAPAPPTSGAAPRNPLAAQDALAAQGSSAEMRRYVIVNGDRMSGSWDTEEVSTHDLRARFGEHFAWFRQNGREYLITDRSTLAEIDKTMEPQMGVNRMQAEVNDAQARVNGLQAKVNSHQNDVNALQNQVNRRQDLANEIQEAVNKGDNGTLVQKLEAEIKQLGATKPDVNQASANRMQSQVNQEQSGVNAEQSKVNEMQNHVNEEQRRVSSEIGRKLQEVFLSAVRSGSAKELK